MRFLTIGTNALVQLNHVIVIEKHPMGSGTKWTLTGGAILNAPDISLEQAMKAIKESEELP